MNIIFDQLIGILLISVSLIWLFVAIVKEARL